MSNPEPEPQVVTQVLAAFARRFDELGYNEDRTPLVADGSGKELQSAGWLYYEGLDGTYGEALLDEQVPVMVMNVLVKRHRFRWNADVGADARALAVVHPELEHAVDRQRLIEMGRASFGGDADLKEAPDAVAALEGLGAVISAIVNRQVDRNRRSV